MKIYKTLFWGLISLLLFAEPSIAQVTIGSAKAPIKGALLELNDGTIDVSNAAVNAKKGLGLPRVELQALNSLQMGATTPDYADKKEEHTGLVVYNINPIYDGLGPCPLQTLGIGVHVWDGSNWQGINTKKSDVDQTEWKDNNDGTGLLLTRQNGKTIMMELVFLPIMRAIAIPQSISSLTMGLLTQVFGPLLISILPSIEMGFP